MDVFNHNWTQRMKNEPYINTVLNSTPPEQIVIHNVQKFSRKRHRFVETQHPYPYTKERLYEAMSFLQNNPPERRDRMDSNDIQVERFDFIRHGRVFDGVYPLYDNTRPNSLYNLRYATIR